MPASTDSEMAKLWPAFRFWISIVFRVLHPVPLGALGGLLGAGFTRGLIGGVFGGAAEDFVAEFAIGDFVQGDIHKGHSGGDGDHGAVAEAKLTDAFRDHID